MSKLTASFTDRSPAPARVCFFVRSGNDWDHMAPILSELLERGRIQPSVFIYDALDSYDTDYRLVQFRKSPRGLRVMHMSSLLGPIQRLRLAFASRAHSSLVTLLTRLRRPLFVRVVRTLANLTRRMANTAVEMLDAHRVLRMMCPNDEPAVIVFDHTAHVFACRIVERAKALGHLTVSVPHALPHLRIDKIANPAFHTPPLIQQIKEYLTNYQGGPEALNMYDHVIVPNEAEATRNTRYGLDPSRIHVMGSARYSAAWIARLRSMLPNKAPLPQSTPGRRNVLFILNKQMPFVDWQAVIAVLRFLAGRRDIVLLVKTHPRAGTDMPVLSGENLRFEVANPDVPTPALIDWSELVVFWSSSAIYDALRLRKPIIHLRYLYGLGFDFEDAIYSWSARDLQHVGEILDRWITAGEPPYPESEAAACLERYVDAGSNRVLQAHAEFVEDLCLGATRRQAHPMGGDAN